MQAPTSPEQEFTGPSEQAVAWGEELKRKMLLAGTKSVHLSVQSLAGGMMHVALLPDLPSKTPRRQVA